MRNFTIRIALSFCFATKVVYGVSPQVKHVTPMLPPSIQAMIKQVALPPSITQMANDLLKRLPATAILPVHSQSNPPQSPSPTPKPVAKPLVPVARSIVQSPAFQAPISNPTPQSIANSVVQAVQSVATQTVINPTPIMATGVKKPAPAPVKKSPPLNPSIPIGPIIKDLSDLIPDPIDDPIRAYITVSLDIDNIFPAIEAFLVSPNGLKFMDEMIKILPMNEPRSFSPSDAAMKILNGIDQRTGLHLTTEDIKMIRDKIKNVKEVQVRVQYDQDELQRAIFDIAELVVCRYYRHQKLGLGLFKRILARRYCRSRNWFRFVPNYLHALSSEETLKIAEAPKIIINPTLAELGLKDLKFTAVPYTNFNLKDYRARIELRFSGTNAPAPLGPFNIR